MTSQEYLAIRLRAEADRAENDLRAQKRGEKVVELGSIRRELRETRERYQSQSVQIKAERALIQEIQNRISYLVSAIGESWKQRPEVAVFLPEDPDVIKWQARNTALENERDTLIHQRDSIPRTDPSWAISCEGSNGRIAQLEYAERNLIEALKGSLGKLPEGGITGVS